MSKFALILPFILASAPAAYAGEDFPACWDSPNDRAPAKIIGSGHVPIEGIKICDDSDVCSFAHPYLLPGDHVLVRSGVSKGYRCVHYTNGQRETSGWVATSSLAPEAPPEHPKLSSWIGHWSAYRATNANDDIGGYAYIDAVADGMKIHATGEAVNGGGHGDHIGDIDGRAAPVGRRLVIDTPVIDTPASEGCSVTLTLLGHYLLADDTGHCGPYSGGGNFTNMYVRMPPPKPGPMNKLLHPKTP